MKCANIQTSVVLSTWETKERNTRGKTEDPSLTSVTSSRNAIEGFAYVYTQYRFERGRTLINDGEEIKK